MAKSAEEIVTEAERMIERVLNNNIKCETCPEKKLKAQWKREKVKQELAAKLLLSVGPSQLKGV